MTNGELFITENPNIEFKLNGSCVWIYFDGVNHYTMPVEWWDKEISLFNKIRAEIEQIYQEIDTVSHNEYENAVEQGKERAYENVLDIIDKYRNEVNE